MPLIDHTFFVGDLNIPNCDKPEVLEDLTRFITIYEDKYLTNALGYDLHKEFKAALTGENIDQKWVELLVGAEYTYAGRTHKWKGLIENAITTNGLLTGYRYKPGVIVKAGDNPEMVPGTSSATFTDWVGWYVVIEKIGYGTQKPGIDYTYDKTTGKWDLLNGAVFAKDEYFFVTFNLSEAMGMLAVNETKTSPIANYVFFYYVRKHIKRFTGNAVTVAKHENAIAVSPADLMAEAWDEMVENNWLLAHFLNANMSTYFNWSNYHYGRVNEVFIKINPYF